MGYIVTKLSECKTANVSAENLLDNIEALSYIFLVIGLNPT